MIFGATLRALWATLDGEREMSEGERGQEWGMGATNPGGVPTPRLLTEAMEAHYKDSEASVVELLGLQGVGGPACPWGNTEHQGLLLLLQATAALRTGLLNPNRDTTQKQEKV